MMEHQCILFPTFVHFSEVLFSYTNLNGMRVHIFPNFSTFGVYILPNTINKLQIVGQIPMSTHKFPIDIENAYIEEIYI